MSNKLKQMLPPRRKLWSLLAISFASSFMVFFYTPFDIYLHNLTEFHISIVNMMLPLLVMFLICFVIIALILVSMWHKKIMVGVIILGLLAVCMIIARLFFTLFSSAIFYMLAAVAFTMVVWVLLLKLLKEEALDVAMLLIWGLIAAGYIQTLFLNGEMVDIMGQQTGYSALTFGNIINLAIWMIIAIAPISIFILTKALKKNFRYEKALVLSVAIISGMQITGLVSTAISTDIPEGFDENPLYYSFETTTDLSSDTNIIVIILDSLDTRVTREVFELYPHLRDYLDGFTLFENTVTEYANTFPSVPSMLTQHYYTYGQDQLEYFEEAWSRYTFIDALRDNGFATNLYLDMASTYLNTSFLDNRTNNFKEADQLKFHPERFLPVVTRFSLGRLSPYLLKNIWMAPVAPSLGNYLYSYDFGGGGSFPWISIETDVNFFNYIQHNEISTTNESNTFLFLHFTSVHNDGYRFDEESGQILFGGNKMDVGRASFEMLNLYFNRMKDAGVYDNSIIIVTGDHGLRDIVKETVSLFVKPKNSTGELITDTTTELSHKYFAASILELAGIPHSAFGISYFDIINGLVPVPQTRVLYAPGNEEGDLGVDGDANNLENWRFIPSGYSP